MALEKGCHYDLGVQHCLTGMWRVAAREGVYCLRLRRYHQRRFCHGERYVHFDDCYGTAEWTLSEVVLYNYRYTKRFVVPVMQCIQREVPTMQNYDRDSGTTYSVLVRTAMPRVSPRYRRPQKARSRCLLGTAYCCPRGAMEMVIKPDVK